MLVTLYKNGDGKNPVQASPSQMVELMNMGYTREPVKESPKKMAVKAEPMQEVVKEEPVVEEDSSNKKRGYLKKSTSEGK